MRCPKCGEPSDGPNVFVIDSRPVPTVNAVRRRRECRKCGQRFTTMEHVVAGKPVAAEMNDEQLLENTAEQLRFYGEMFGRIMRRRRNEVADPVAAGE